MDEFDSIKNTYAAKGGSTLNSDTLFSLEVHAVHLGSNTILAANIVNRIDSPCVKENSFGQGSFPTVDMCTDTDISKDRVFIAHPANDTVAER